MSGYFKALLATVALGASVLGSSPSFAQDPYAPAPYGATAPALQPAPSVIAPVPQVAPARPPAGFVRLVPFFGSNGFDYDRGGNFDNLGDGQSYGAFVDIGPSYLTGETGLYYSNNPNKVVGDQNINFDYWAIPMALKLNFSGNPNSTVYLKAGVVLLDETGQIFDQLDWSGQLGAGFALPLGSSAAAIVVEGDYNTLLTRNAISTPLDGWSFIGGLSIRL